MTTALNQYIKNRIISTAARIDFHMGWEEVLAEEVDCWFYMPRNKSDNANEKWTNYKGDIQATMRAIYMPTLNRLDDCDGVADFLENNTGGVADWRYWFNTYASSYAWIDDENDLINQGDEIRDRCVEVRYKTSIINFQAHIRRRQATIRVIRKLHLTGSLH
tara:strand:+ start:275 stop:760 length:486 start_codon:yes stop_codon:yes gene_type:complete